MGRRATQSRGVTVGHAERPERVRDQGEALEWRLRTDPSSSQRPLRFRWTEWEAGHEGTGPSRAHPHPRDLRPPRGDSPRERQGGQLQALHHGLIDSMAKVSTNRISTILTRAREEGEIPWARGSFRKVAPSKRCRPGGTRRRRADRGERLPAQQVGGPTSAHNCGVGEACRGRIPGPSCSSRSARSSGRRRARTSGMRSTSSPAPSGPAWRRLGAAEQLAIQYLD
jgi:hypothetical protein